VVVLRGGEEDLGLAEQQGLLLGLVADVEHRDVGPDEPGLALPALGIGPDEPASGDAEVEAVTVDFLHLRQGERQAAHVVGGGHRGSLRSGHQTKHRLDAGTDIPAILLSLCLCLCVGLATGASEPEIAFATT
jgi:hypothetical protein